MTVHRARAIGLAAVLIGISAIVSLTASCEAQQSADEVPLDELRVLAEQGVAEAQAGLGAMYLQGQDVPQNDAEAVRWFRLAADQGLALVQIRLGGAYATGPVPVSSTW